MARNDSRFFAYCYGHFHFYAMPQEDIIVNGTVKWFNDGKGYGFISNDEAGDINRELKKVRKFRLKPNPIPKTAANCAQST